MKKPPVAAGTGFLRWLWCGLGAGEPAQGGCSAGRKSGRANAATAWPPPGLRRRTGGSWSSTQRCQFAASATMQWLDIRLHSSWGLQWSALLRAVWHCSAAPRGHTRQPRCHPGPFSLTSEACYSSSPPSYDVSLLPASFHLLTRIPCEDVVILKTVQVGDAESRVTG